MATTPDIPLADYAQRWEQAYRASPRARESQTDADQQVSRAQSHVAGDAETAEENTNADIGEREQVNLPRVDGGKEAWLFLAGSFMIEALVWGRWNSCCILDLNGTLISSNAV